MLSPRQCEIALLISRGFSNKQIAAELGISPHTVDKYLRSAFDRLAVKTRTRTEFVVRCFFRPLN